MSARGLSRLVLHPFALARVGLVCSVDGTFDDRYNMCRDTEQRVDILDVAKCLVCQEMLLSTACRLDATLLCGRADGALPDCYRACSRACQVKFDGVKKNRVSMQLLSRRLRGSHLKTEIAVGDVVVTIEDMSAHRFVEGGRGTVERRLFNPVTNKTDFTVRFTVGGPTQTVGASGLRIRK